MSRTKFHREPQVAQRPDFGHPCLTSCSTKLEKLSQMGDEKPMLFVRFVKLVLPLQLLIERKHLNLFTSHCVNKYV